jgi:hypothetical protein
MFSKASLVKVFLAMLVLGLLVSACSAASTPQADYGNESLALSPESAEPSSDTMGMEKAAYDEGFINDTTQPAIPVERLVIKDADLSLVVGDPSSSMDAIGKMAEEMGGYIVSATLYQTEIENGVKAPQASITIRVPAEKLNDALERIKKESDQDPLSESITSQDVTSEYVDLQSRLTNLEATEEQLRAIMEDAEETEDVLAVYNQLVKVREEIEVIKGRMKYLEQSSALSSIHTELLANAAVQPVTIGGWQPTGVAKGALQALINGLKFLANVAIWLVIFVLPIALILFVVVFLPIRWIVRRVRRKRAKSTPEESNQPGDEKPETA